MEKAINWQPEHFPLGTVVTLKNYIKLEGFFVYRSDLAACHCAQVTVRGICHYGDSQYLIDTGELSARTGNKHTFNFSHVGSIIKRGEGPVKVDYGYNRDSVNIKRTLTNDVLNKRKYYSTGVVQLLRYLVQTEGSFQKGMCLNEQGFQLFYEQSFIKYHDLRCISADKKRARRWVHQNINRLVMPMKEVKRLSKLEEERQRRLYYDDMEREMDEQLDLIQLSNLEMKE